MVFDDSTGLLEERRPLYSMIIASRELYTVQWITSHLNPCKRPWLNPACQKGNTKEDMKNDMRMCLVEGGIGGSGIRIREGGRMNGNI